MPKIEIVDFYPLYGKPGKKVVFSCHICVITKENITFDIRGYTVHMNYTESETSRNSVYPPMQNEFDYEDKKCIRFPIVTFLLLNENYDFNEKIKEEIIHQGKNFLKNFKFPHKFPRNYKQYMRVRKLGLEEGMKKQEGKPYDKKRSFNKPMINRTYVNPPTKKPLF